MRCTPSKTFPEVVIIEPDVYKDSRGYFLETYRLDRYSDSGVPVQFVQDNLSVSRRGTLRGLHYQLARPQGKLIYTVEGEIFDVMADIRKGSPMFGKWQGIVLSADNHRQLYIPEGFAHGFCVTSERACIMYKCTDFYDPSSERGIIWNDPSLAVAWPVEHPVLSPKDSRYPTLGELPEDDLPVYSPPVENP
ncbi:dTDP-4-dehydrorhamnose 3,5-epimerase [bacterium]|nr:dTDP-4-dehydrorhamnose 3,5-epimerase [bacterium]